MKHSPERQPVHFSPGKIVATPGVLEAVSQPELLQALARHLCGDWGEVCAADAEQNNRALEQGWSLLSVYPSSEDRVFWVITEADRSATTILLPREY